jgi:hypothetical protein
MPPINIIGQNMLLSGRSRAGASRNATTPKAIAPAPRARKNRAAARWSRNPACSSRRRSSLISPVFSVE